MTNTDKTLDALIATRNELAETLSCCIPGASPGTPAWREEQAAMAALETFDSEHPEALRAIRKAQKDAIGSGWGM